MKATEDTPIAESPTSNCYLESSALSAAGHQKAKNEDSILDLTEYGIYCVADGIGGETAGKTASEYLTEGIKQQCWDTSFDSEKMLITTLKEAVSRANVRIRRFARSNDLEGVGSTVAILHLNPLKGSAVIMHAGDSRVYRLRKKKLAQLTQDHTMSGELGLSEGDDISHIIQEKLTKAVGLFDRIDLEVQSIEILPNDIFLVCSSGFYSVLKDDEITTILNTSVGDGVESAVKKLHEETQQRQSQEDVSVVLVQVVSEIPIGAANGPNKVLLAVIGVFIALAIILGVVYFGKKNEAGINKGKEKEEIVNVSGELSNPLENPQTKANSTSETSSPSIDRKEIKILNDSLKPENVQQKNGVRTDSQKESSEDIVGNESTAEKGTQPVNEKGTTSSLDSEIASQDGKESLAQKQEFPNNSKNNSGSMNGVVQKIPSDSKPLDIAVSTQDDKSQTPPIVIKNPEMGTTRTLVEIYNDGTIEMSTLPDHPEPKVATDGLKETKPGSGSEDIQKEPGTQDQPQPKSDPQDIPEPAEQAKSTSMAMIPQEHKTPLPNPIEQINNNTTTSKLDNVIENQTQIKEGSIEAVNLLEEIRDISKRWETMKSKEKDESGNSILRKLEKAVSDAKIKNHRDGNELWKVFQEAKSIHDNKLQENINEIMLNYETDLASYLKTTVTNAQKTCDWSEVDTILQENSEMGQELKDLKVIKSAHSWTRLTVQANNDDQYFREYVNNFNYLLTKLKPLFSLPEDSDYNLLDIKEIQKNLSSTPIELCKQITYNNSRFRSRLLEATERLTLNLKIIDEKSLERILQFTYPDKTPPSSDNKNLQFIKTGLKMISDLEQGLISLNKWEFSENMLDKLGDPAKKLLVLFYQTQHHLRFLKEVLVEYKQMSNRMGKFLFKDNLFVDYYINEFSKINTVFSQDDARILKYRISKSITSDK